MSPTIINKIVSLAKHEPNTSKGVEDEAYSAGKNSAKHERNRSTGSKESHISGRGPEEFLSSKGHVVLATRDHLRGGNEREDRFDDGDDRRFKGERGDNVKGGKIIGNSRDEYTSGGAAGSSLSPNDNTLLSSGVRSEGIGGAGGSGGAERSGGGLDPTVLTGTTDASKQTSSNPRAADASVASLYNESRDHAGRENHGDVMDEAYQAGAASGRSGAPIQTGSSGTSAYPTSGGISGAGTSGRSAGVPSDGTAFAGAGASGGHPDILTDHSTSALGGIHSRHGTHATTSTGHTGVSTDHTHVSSTGTPTGTSTGNTGTYAGRTGDSTGYTSMSAGHTGSTGHTGSAGHTGFTGHTGSAGHGGTPTGTHAEHTGGLSTGAGAAIGAGLGGAAYYALGKGSRPDENVDQSRMGTKNPTSIEPGLSGEGYKHSGSQNLSGGVGSQNHQSQSLDPHRLGPGGHSVGQLAYEAGLLAGRDSNRSNAYSETSGIGHPKAQSDERLKFSSEQQHAKFNTYEGKESQNLTSHGKSTKGSNPKDSNLDDSTLIDSGYIKHSTSSNKENYAPGAKSTSIVPGADSREKKDLTEPSSVKQTLGASLVSADEIPTPHEKTNRPSHQSHLSTTSTSLGGISGILGGAAAAIGLGSLAHNRSGSKNEAGVDQDVHLEVDESYGTTQATQSGTNHVSQLRHPGLSSGEKKSDLTFGEIKSDVTSGEGNHSSTFGGPTAGVRKSGLGDSSYSDASGIHGSNVGGKGNMPTTSDGNVKDDRTLLEIAEDADPSLKKLSPHQPLGADIQGNVTSENPRPRTLNESNQNRSNSDSKEFNLRNNYHTSLGSRNDHSLPQDHLGSQTEHQNEAATDAGHPPSSGSLKSTNMNSTSQRLDTSREAPLGSGLAAGVSSSAFDSSVRRDGRLDPNEFQDEVLTRETDGSKSSKPSLSQTELGEKPCTPVSVVGASSREQARVFAKEAVANLPHDLLKSGHEITVDARTGYVSGESGPIGKIDSTGRAGAIGATSASSDHPHTEGHRGKTGDAVSAGNHADGKNTANHAGEYSENYAGHYSGSSHLGKDQSVPKADVHHSAISNPVDFGRRAVGHEKQDNYVMPGSFA